MRARIIIAVAGVLLGCTACGFKGPLYLPQQNAAVVTHPAPSGTVKSPPRTTRRDAKKNSGGTPSGAAGP